jgi:hypothetical protein
MWNQSVRLYGCGDPVHMSREQIEARYNYLRARGRTCEATDLIKAWLAAEKTQRAAV